MAREAHPCGNVDEGDVSGAAFGPEVQSCDRHGHNLYGGVTPVKTLCDANRTGDNCQIVHVRGIDNCHDGRIVSNPMYRPSANPPRTAWARHLDQVMRDKKWSRVRLFEEIGAELGYSPKSRSALLPILEDKEPNPAQAAVLTRHFGEPLAAPLDDSAPRSDTLSGAESLAAAILALTAELREARQERAALTEKVAQMDEMIDVLDARTSAIEAEHAAHPHSTESGRR